MGAPSFPRPITDSLITLRSVVLSPLFCRISARVARAEVCAQALPANDLLHREAGYGYQERRNKPTISQFYGILIRMFFSDHAPPHFHAVYGESQATIDIDRLRAIEGELPRRALELALDWAEVHRGELLENWRLCRDKQPPRRIDPLR